MPTYRVIYRDNTDANSGWFADVTEDTPEAAAWNQAVKSTAAQPDQPPVLVSITPLSD